MTRPSIGAPLALLLSFLLSLAVVPTEAGAVNVTVGSTTYDVQFNDTGSSGTSFNADSALIQASPWWGNAALASDFATAYGAQVTPPYPFDRDYSGAGVLDFLLFSYATDGTDNDSHVLRDDGGFTTFTLNNVSSFPNGFYAFASTPPPVPEIDGGALGQGAVILLAVWLMLRRRAGPITSA